jgi:hypothetical protein
MEFVMRHLKLLLALGLLAGCAKKEPVPEPAPPPPPPAPAPINLADVAGTWTVKAMPEVGDSVLVTYTIMATASDSGWTITLPKQKPTPVTVMASGDSLIITSPEMNSALRKGVKMMTESSVHLRDGKLMGMTTAHYKVTTPDSVVRLRLEGTKNP